MMPEMADTMSPTILGLIDEPFHGTNFQERTAAGIALLEHLMATNHFFLMATRQESLAQSAATCKTAANYHFQEELTETGIQFNYRLQPGPATTRTPPSTGATVPARSTPGAESIVSSASMSASTLRRFLYGSRVGL